MRVSSNVTVPHRGDELPLWPPLIATTGAGGRSEPHMHHGMHLVLAKEGELAIRVGKERAFRRSAGILTAPDVAHELDASGVDMLLVFLDPESLAGTALREVIAGPLRLLSSKERDALLVDASPNDVMRASGVTWASRAVKTLGGRLAARSPLHPRVRRLLGVLREMPADGDMSLEALADTVGLSQGRLMHVFTESIGVPLRPYLAWLKLQRAAGAIAAGARLVDAAHAAGFADAGHMSRTFRRMLGTSPSALRAASRQPVDSRRQASEAAT